MRPLSLTAVLAIGLFGSLPLLGLAGVRINLTSSFPPGLYWALDKPPARGDLVLFCPPVREVFRLARERGYVGMGGCLGGSMPLLKRLVGEAGDEVVIGPNGVSVNGLLQANSLPLAQDPAGRAMPHPQPDCFRLAPGEVLMLSDYNPLSFDARYFGAIPREQLAEVVRPLLVWDRAAR